MDVSNKTIGDLVDENFIFARAFHYLGIEFFLHEHDTLETICKKNKIDQTSIVKSFSRLEGKTRMSFGEISKYSIEFTLEYLRYAHHSYIKEYLPYIARLINSLPNSQQIIQDLKTVFPLFIEDFILHIYHEEDSLFAYLDVLKHPINLEENPIKKMWPYRKMDLKAALTEHQNENEMESIRLLAEELPEENVLIKVIKKEIMAFDREMLYHSKIENQILFPKAIQLEKEVWNMLNQYAILN